MKQERTFLEQKLFDALLEASSIFDNYPQVAEDLPGTFEVVNDAINLAFQTTKENETYHVQLKAEQFIKEYQEKNGKDFVPPTNELVNATKIYVEDRPYLRKIYTPKDQQFFTNYILSKITTFMKLA